MILAHSINTIQILEFLLNYLYGILLLNGVKQQFYRQSLYNLFSTNIALIRVALVAPGFQNLCLVFMIKCLQLQLRLQLASHWIIRKKRLILFFLLVPVLSFVRDVLQFCFCLLTSGAIGYCPRNFRWDCKGV